MTMANSWLKLDAKNRAWRTILQGLVAVVLLPALDAALQTVMVEVTHSQGRFDWGRVTGLAVASALTAVTMSVAAYVHRLKLDVSAIPSAEPPRPPGVTERQAPATDPTKELT
jgi:hypothetical protein